MPAKPPPHRRPSSPRCLNGSAAPWLAAVVLGFCFVAGPPLGARAESPTKPAKTTKTTKPPKTNAQPTPPDAKPATRVEWKRDGIGRIEVTGSRTGTHLKEATATLQAVADRLDCLRTHKPHVRWSRLTWVDGRIKGVAVADSGVYGNVALLALRDLLPGRSTAGSGIQQIRGRTDRESFRIRILLGAPRR